MNQQAEQLYQEMLLELDHCKHRGLREMVVIECMFTISNNYWEILKTALEHYEFEKLEEEIDKANREGRIVNDLR